MEVTEKKNGIEVLDVIDNWNLGFYLGSAVAKIHRSGNRKSKDKMLKDLKSAENYIRREINKQEA